MRPVTRRRLGISAVGTLAAAALVVPSTAGMLGDIERPAEQYRGRYQLRLDRSGDLSTASAEHRLVLRFSWRQPNPRREQEFMLIQAPPRA
jgi:hypothetical protein